MTAHRYIYRAQILAVVDGDTVVTDTDLGRGLSVKKDRLRLNGIDAPDKGEAGYFESKAHLASLLEVGEYYQIETFKNREKYGRFLANIYLTDGRSVNDLMVLSGHAALYTA